MRSSTSFYSPLSGETLVWFGKKVRELAMASNQLTRTRKTTLPPAPAATCFTVQRTFVYSAGVATRFSTAPEGSFTSYVSRVGGEKVWPLSLEKVISASPLALFAR